MANQQSNPAAKSDATKAADEAAKLATLARSSIEPSAAANGSDSAIDRLAAAEAEIRRLTEQLAAKEAEADAVGGLKINPSDRPFTGDTGGWKFRVGPIAKDKYPMLPVREIMACDESEAKRWYCASHDYPAGSRRAIDPVAIEISVTCLDERRNQLMIRKARFATIRQKLFAGQALTNDEEKILQSNQEEIEGLRR